MAAGEDAEGRLRAALSDRYSIEREIGSGGMATVYLAEDLKHHRRVAIKVLDPDLARSLGAERFLREIDTVAGLTHPHVLPLYDSGEADGFLYYVMPFVEGESLRARIDREGPLPVEEALRIAREVADALGHAHTLGIVHRDIKPGNILLEAGHAVVSDFGIARAVDAAGGESLTQTGLAMGTPAYMSPEQAAGEEHVDGRSDLYSLGCVLYEMLGGEVPLMGRTPQALIAKKLSEPPLRVSVLRKAVPEAVDDALVKALARVPADRYGTAAELGAALGVDVAAASGPPPSARGGRWRVAVGVAVALLLGALALSVLDRGEDASEPSWIRNLATLEADRPTIAVLPLTNLSAEEDNAYFAAGVHEELLRLLSLVRELGVISRTSVLRYAGATQSIPEIASELGARYLVEGSVQEAGGQVRIHVQLIDATTDQHLWAHRYDRSLEDVFALQSEVAQAIAGELQAVVSPEERERLEARPTQDALAYELYLRAIDRNVYVREDWDAAVELLRRATSRDTAFALAHAWLAWGFVGGAVAHEVPGGYDSAMVRAETAIRFDADLPVAHAVRGFVLADLGHREEGEAALQRALSLNPSLGDAWGALAAIGWWYSDFVQGALAGRQGARVDPRSWNTMLHLSNCLAYMGMSRESAAWIERVLEVEPHNIWALWKLAFGSLLSGDEANARAYAARMREAGADNPNVLGYAGLFEVLRGDLDGAVAALEAIDASALTTSTSGYPTAEALLGWAEIRTGRPGGVERLENLRSRRLAQSAAESTSLTRINDLSVIASVLGDEEEQLRWFREAIGRAPLMVHPLRGAPWYDGIRDHPDFQAWLRASEELMAGYRRELAAMGPWMPEEVLGVGNR
jgi:serine/threonine-protein kinase